MEIKTYQEEVDLWIKTVGVRYFSELTNMSLEEQKESLADELADVIWVAVCLANQTGIDLQAALAKNLEKKSKRDSLRHVNNEKLK